MKKHSKAALAAAVAAAVLLVLALFLFWRAGQDARLPDMPLQDPTPAASSPSPTPTPVPTPEPTDCETSCPVPDGTPPVESVPVEEEDDGLPTDKFFITVPRQNYRDGDLRLVIPKLEVDVPILNGVDSATLLRGEGLYDYAQLPSETRSNTSIAGHRNWVRGGKITLDQPFSYLDTLEEGDYIYLRDGENIYQYVFEFQEVVESDDWGPIYKTDHSCVTLTTCTPVGVSDHRLVVRGELVATIPVAEDYAYPASTAEEEAATP